MKRDLFLPSFKRKSYFFHLFHEDPEPTFEPYDGPLACEVTALISADHSEKKWIKSHQKRNFTKMRREYNAARKKRRCIETCVKHGEEESLSEDDMVSDSE